MKKRVYIILIVVLAVIGALLIYKYTFNEENTGVKKFTNEYTLVSDDNVFVYKSVDEIINTLEKGSGIIFLGFPECAWCQKYALYLNEVAKENNIKEIYYYNIKDIRSNNTNKYQKIVSYLESYLPTDDSQNKRITVPNVTFVKDGNVLFNDNETSLISDGTQPDDYYSEEAISALKNKLTLYFEKYNSYSNSTSTCTNCNE